MSRALRPMRSCKSLGQGQLGDEAVGGRKGGRERIQRFRAEHLTARAFRHADEFVVVGRSAAEFELDAPDLKGPGAVVFRAGDFGTGGPSVGALRQPARVEA